MFVEERMYTLKIGAVPEYLRHYQNDGFTEVGGLNMIVHMWAYESRDQRDRCRAATKIRPLMEREETRIMKCAPFFVERLKKMLAAVE
jgi:hypothetical protein